VLQFQYSALAREHEQQLLPFAQRHELGVIVWAPLASGFLTDGFSLDAIAEDDFRRTHPFAELDLAETHDELRARGNGSITRGALDFVLSHSAVTGAIVGARNEREGRDLAAMG
jgi:aryl-alcohol dehydrogenase-like predicted oxidoreductase